MPCNPDGNTVTWECQVYSPRNPGSSLSVKWYRSASVVSVREEGELIEEQEGGRYTFTVTRATSPLNDSQMIVNGLFLDHFQLTIHNYESSIDGGYYWCQMVVNDTICLQPSDIGCIPPNSVPVPTRSCLFSSFDFIQFEIPQVCARRSSCTREVTDSETGPPITSNQGQTASSTFGTTFAASNSIESESGTMAVTFYAVIGVLVFIVAILLLVILAFVVLTLRNHNLRVYEVKQQCKWIFIDLCICIDYSLTAVC